MGEGAHMTADFAVPGGIDFGLAYANGDITREQFIAYQSAAIAAEFATGYVAGKVVKGVVKTTQRLSRLTKELGTAKGFTKRAKSAPRVMVRGLDEIRTLQQMSGKVNRHGAEAKALRETREARSAGLEKLAQRQETELFLRHNKGSRQAFERKVDALDDLAKRGKLAKTQSVRDPSLTDKYRDTLLKRAEREWKHSDPEKLRKFEDLFDKVDADHLHELQLGGLDHFSALTMLDKGVNRSVGSQLGHQLRKLPDGTKITRVLEKGAQ